MYRANVLYANLQTHGTIHILSTSLHTRLYTEILEVNLFAFAYRLFHENFSPLDGAIPYYGLDY